MRKYLFALFATLMVFGPTFGQSALEKQTPKAEFDGIEINWPAIDDHSIAILQIGGPDLRQQHTFKDGEAPFFRPLSEGIKPGVIYSFKIEYQPDELARKKDEFREARKNRDRELAMRLFYELQQNTVPCPMASGRFQVDEDGNVKTYDLKSTLEKAAEKKKAKSKKEDRETESGSEEI